jgi:hypothetical protein
VRVLVGYEKILKENQRFLSGQTSLIDLFRSPSGTRVSPIVRVLVGYEDILKENKRFLSGQTLLFDFFRSTSGTVASPTVLLDTMDDYQCDFL